MYYCCKHCDDCCRDCCKCCEECCGEYCDAISECFQTPFSFCTFLSFFITCIPFILMIIAIIQSASYNCVENIKPHIIVQGICNLLNFLFCIYLMCQYGKSYDNQQGDHRDHDGPDEYNLLQRTVNLILYDFVVCFYIFFVIFFFIWTFVGFSWNSDEPELSPCRMNNDGFIMVAHLINLWTMLIFLIVGFLVFIIMVCIYGCEDGSCTFHDSNRCICLICTCGICDIGKKKKQKYTNQQAWSNKQQYQSSRQQWIHSFKRNCGCLSLDRNKRKQHYQDQNQNQNVIQMNQQAQMQPYQQQPIKQKKHKRKQGFWSWFNCFRSNNHNSQSQNPPAQNYGLVQQNAPHQAQQHPVNVPLQQPPPPQQQFAPQPPQQSYNQQYVPPPQHYGPTNQQFVPPPSQQYGQPQQPYGPPQQYNSQQNQNIYQQPAPQRLPFGQQSSPPYQQPPQGQYNYPPQGGWGK